MSILAPKCTYKHLKIYILAPKMYIKAPKLYILAPKNVHIRT